MTAILTNSGRGHASLDNHAGSALAGKTSSDHIRSAAQSGSIAERGGDGSSIMTVATQHLQIAAATLSDIEAVRIATQARLESWDREGPGQVPERIGIQAQLEALLSVEHQAELEAGRALRRHPLGVWAKSAVGIGPKQGARLIAAIGDPYWNTADDRPRRGPAELWAYCGYVPGQRRRRGEKSNWSSEAKMRAYLCAESCVKQAHSPYRPVYDAGRAHYVDSVHDDPCPRCGPAGKPALAGSSLSLGHQHARALRLVAKAILRDLYVAARDVHQA